MASVSIVLKTKKPLANNEFAVALRVSHKSIVRFYNYGNFYLNDGLKFRCRKEDWISAEIGDNGYGRFKKTIPNYKELNKKS